jgi:uncharacterized protein
MALDVVESVLEQARAPHRDGHRPWPKPRSPWVMAQTWRHLLFAHWRVSEDALRALVPPQLPIDTADGSAWIGVTPFGIQALRAHGTPPLPGLSSFPELNVRTYVSVDGKPGIYFFSLDAASRLAVEAARRIYRLPYFHARMSIERDTGEITYRSRRKHDAAPAAFEGRYRPLGPAFRPAAGSLAHWLTERYCLYTLDEGQRVMRGDIQHPPWNLRQATADIAENTMTAPLGLELSGDPLLHYAARQDVVFWLLSTVNGPRHPFAEGVSGRRGRGTTTSR